MVFCFKENIRKPLPAQPHPCLCWGVGWAWARQGRPPRPREEKGGLYGGFLRAREELSLGTEFGFVRQKKKIKKSTRVPTIQMRAKRHHLRVGTISGSWTKGPGVALAPRGPMFWGGRQGRKQQLSGQKWGEKGESQSNLLPHMVKTITKKAPEA